MFDFFRMIKYILPASIEGIRSAVRRFVCNHRYSLKITLFSRFYICKKCGKKIYPVKPWHILEEVE